MATKKQKPPADLLRARATTLDKFVRVASDAMAKQPKLRSVTLTCMQSVLSEDGDAIVGSSRNPVILDVDSVPSNERLGSVDGGAAFAAMVDPDDYAEYGLTYGPLAIVERVSGSIRAAWIGAPVRTSFDRPTKPVKQPPLKGKASALYKSVLAEPSDLEARGVLRDHWLDIGDVRGEFAALTMAPQTAATRARAAAIVLEHGRSWLGKLQDVVLMSGALFGQGPFLRKAIVFLEDEAAWKAVENAPEWATVEELVFGRFSERGISPMMKNLRSVGPIDVDQLEAFETGTWLVNELDFELRSAADLKALAAVDLPLKRLRLRSGAIDLAPLAKASWFHSLELIELWLPEETKDAADAMVAAFAKLAKRAPCKVAVGTLSYGQRSGYMITGTAKARALELHQPDLRTELGEQLAKRLRKKAPTTWQPQDLDWLPLGFGVARS